MTKDHNILYPLKVPHQHCTLTTLKYSIQNKIFMAEPAVQRRRGSSSRSGAPTAHGAPGREPGSAMPQRLRLALYTAWGPPRAESLPTQEHPSHNCTGAKRRAARFSWPKTGTLGSCRLRPVDK